MKVARTVWVRGKDRGSNIRVLPIDIQSEIPITDPPPTGIDTHNATELFSMDGFIFVDSSIRYLTEDEIYRVLNSHHVVNDGISVYSTRNVIQFMISEIYARHGKIFGIEREPFRSHYNSYEWYLLTDKKSDEEIVAVFNEYEQSNVNLLVGFRNNYQ
jgi:hypothetical protein